MACQAKTYVHSLFQIFLPEILLRPKITKGLMLVLQELVTLLGGGCLMLKNLVGFCEYC